MTAIFYDFSENCSESGEEKYELYCPNQENHKNENEDGHDENCPCGCEYGTLEPIYNYVHPVEYYTYSKEHAIKIASETSCILLEDGETGDCIIALTGCGMDLSPDIIYSFCITKCRIPVDLLESMRVEWMKTQLGKKWDVIKPIVIDQLKSMGSFAEHKLEEVKQ